MDRGSLTQQCCITGAYRVRRVSRAHSTSTDAEAISVRKRVEADHQRLKWGIRPTGSGGSTNERTYRCFANRQKFLRNRSASHTHADRVGMWQADWQPTPRALPAGSRRVSAEARPCHMGHVK